MAVTLPESVLARYRRFSLYNSPFDAHDRGCAIDLYPEADRTTAPSPVAGEVVDTRTVRAPPKPYAAEHDHLIVIDCGDRLARLLHVDPAVEPGDIVAVGDPLGELVRAGFFAPWVPNHIHLGFRPPDANPYRAAGSLRVEPAVGVEPLAWDGTGRVVDRGETFVVLDEPAHPAPGERFVGMAARSIDGGPLGALDGGFPHYEGGGLLSADAEAALSVAGAGSTAASESERAVALAGDRVGVLSSLRDGARRASLVGAAADRHVDWDDVTVLANGEPITGIALFAARDEFGAKLICPDRSFEIGERVRVDVVRR
ncbi:hypothetical protein SAMN06269185_1470 [Natronoarchaeum philippinense]|uniref:Peptidase family M23 n=1 Tax=Natronoarchaeum philippinense TaxID=558529 RepID=A0A285NWM8_NATPI|nr:hypothetical protein [Natronoarchaeum philippinense]SNZ12041.1 hypothetical protein SAMN06269185_1470 [Natronoarchaeum philippinense]